MIIKFKDRIFEWWLAVNTTLFGVFISMPAESMDSLAFLQLRSFMPESAWGAFFLTTGALHLMALIINGRRWWTPLVRSAVTSLNCFVYILFGVGIFMIDPWSTGVFSYVSTIGSAAAICFYRATKDSTHAIEARANDPQPQ